MVTATFNSSFTPGEFLSLCSCLSAFKVGKGNVYTSWENSRSTFKSKIVVRFGSCERDRTDKDTEEWGERESEGAEGQVRRSQGLGILVKCRCWFARPWIRLQFLCFSLGPASSGTICWFLHHLSRKALDLKWRWTSSFYFYSPEALPEHIKWQSWLCSMFCVLCLLTPERNMLSNGR